MEYVDGHTLKEIIKRRGRIAPKGVVHVLSQMCEALAYAHEKKIVHRDIKTANTMWTARSKAKIMDFGLAKVIEEVRNHTTMVSGTPYYMSPEQTLGQERRPAHRPLLARRHASSSWRPARCRSRGQRALSPRAHAAARSARAACRSSRRCWRRSSCAASRRIPDERYQTAREILAELRVARRRGGREPRELVTISSRA